MATPVKTLKDVLPREFLNGEYDKTMAWWLRNVEVKTEHSKVKEGASYISWLGPQKNVYFWVELVNGYTVGWNENPSRGWTFPVLEPKKSSIKFTGWIEKMKLWKENKLDQEYEMTPEEIVTKFFESPEFEDWRKGRTYASINQLFRHFLTSPTGLNSIMEEEDIMKTEVMIRKDKRFKTFFDEALKASSQRRA